MITHDVLLGKEVDVSDSASLNYVHTGKRGKIRHFTILFGSEKHPVTIGDDFYIGVQCYICGASGLTIGNRVTIAHGAMIFTDSGPNTSPLIQKKYPLTYKPIVIGDDVWIGARAMILPGVKIGNGCVIGAGSLVKDDVPDGTVVGGSPARFISKLEE